MVAIVSGNGLGVNLSSLATLGQRGVFGTAAQGSNGDRVLVNIATGNLVLQSEDEHLAARGADGVALRTYNSQGLLNDDNGDNWSNGFWLQPLVLTGTLNTAGSTLARTDSDGSVALYTWVASLGAYRSTAGGGAFDTLTFLAAQGRLQWRDGDTGATQLYEASGSFRLLSASDASGNTISYGYDAAGRVISLLTASGDSTFYDYSGGNLVQIRTVPAGGSARTAVRYDYDAGNRLASVTVDLTPADGSVADGAVYSTLYGYDAAGRVASIVQSDGTRLAFTYTADNKVASVANGLGQVTTFSHAAGSVVVTDATGAATTYQFDSQGRLTRVTAPAVNNLAALQIFTWNASGDLTSWRDGETRVTNYVYDANGNQVLQRDALGNTVARTFDSRNQLVAETEYVVPDPDGSGALLPETPLTRRYVYDAGGRNLLRFALSAEGRVIEHRYDAFGQRVATLVYAGATYPLGGLATTAVPTEAELAAWAASQPVGAVQRQDFGYDARGALQSSTLYARLDASGAGLLDGTQSRETYVYDLQGRLLQTVGPTGATTALTYDGLGRIVARTDALGQTSSTLYLAGQDVATLANGLVSTRAYDAAGRLASVTESLPSGTVLGVTRYFHDAAGRLGAVQDPTGVTRWILYDAEGRKAADIDGNGTLTEYRYDREDRLVRTIRYDTPVALSLLFDGAGLPNPGVALAEVRPATSTADASSWRMYDAAGRLVREAHTVGTGNAVAVTETRYDGASRVTAVIQYAATVSAPTASAASFSIPLPAASAQDRITRYFHDADGLRVGVLDAEGYLTTFTYDAAGRLVEQVAYASATDPTLRATADLAALLPVASGSDIRNLQLFDAKGQLLAQVDGEGYLTELVRDAAGRVVQTLRYANRVLPAAAGSTIAALRPPPSAADRVGSTVYDALGRVQQETNPEGTVTRYAYDSAGHLLSTTAAVGQPEVRTLLARYDLQGRLTGELGGVGAALLTGGQTAAEIDAIWAQHGLRHAYDAAGRRIATTDALGNTTLFFYNADGALTHTVNALGEVRENLYDASGRLAGEVVYANRIATAGLAGGLVNAALLAAIVADAAADSRTTVSYTRDDRIAASKDALGNITSHAYDVFGDAISRVQSVGGGVSLVENSSYDRRGLRVGTVVDPAGVNAITTVAYDGFGRAIRTVDPNGNVREQAFDRLGRVVVTRDPLGGIESSAYDAFGRVLSHTDASGQVTSYAYDAAARTLTVTTPEGVRTVTAYTRHGQVLSITDGKGQVTSHAYDRDGRLLRTTTPLTTVSSSYDAAGRQVVSIDAAGGQVAYSYDAANRLLTRTVDPAGLALTTRYEYDAKGQQVAVVDANGIRTTIAYDRKGQVVRQIVDPTGLNLQTQYVYDARGKVLLVQSAGGTVTEYGYDALGRRISERIDPGGLNLLRKWSYDKNGNVRSATDAAGGVTRHVYDAADQLVLTIDPTGAVTQLAYDAQGRVVRSTAFASPIDLSALPALPTAAQVQGLLVAQPGRDQVEHRVYDRDGRLAATVDGVGAVVRFALDANGNVLTRTAYANAIDLATWTPGTVPAPAAAAGSDAVQRTVYDALNRAVYTVDGVGAVVAMTYDGTGRVTARTAYATPVPVGTAATKAALDAAVGAIRNAARDATTRNVYDAAGRLVWSADGLGAVTQRIHDGNGNVVRVIAYATAVGAAASPASVAASAADRSTAMVYDAANRLLFTVDALGAVIEQTYDGNGNVVVRAQYANVLASLPALGSRGTEAALRSLLRPDGSTDRLSRYGYDAAGRQVLAVDAEGGAVETGYDGAGRAVRVTQYATRVSAAFSAAAGLVELKSAVRTSSADRVQRNAYDAAGRLLFAVDAEGAVTALDYDALGQVRKTIHYARVISAPGAQSAAAIAAAVVANSAADRLDVFVHDAAGRLVQHTDPLGASESFGYDALGRKTFFVDKNGSRWNYAYDAGGRLVTETSPNVTLARVDEAMELTMVEGSIVTRLGYDALGNLTSRTEAAGLPEDRITRYEYDAVGHQVKITYTLRAANADSVESFCEVPSIDSRGAPGRGS